MRHTLPFACRLMQNIFCISPFFSSVCCILLYSESMKTLEDAAA